MITMTSHLYSLAGLFRDAFRKPLDQKQHKHIRSRYSGPCNPVAHTGDLKSESLITMGNIQKNPPGHRNRDIKGSAVR